MRRFRFVAGALSVLAIVVAKPACAAAPVDARLDALLKHIAPEAHVIIAIPSLKRLNDDITELLGGMDRADMIAAGRPIDLAKSMFGLGGGIDDRRGAAAFIVPGEDVAPTMLAILPVTDQDSFLESNFTHEADTNAYVTASGSALFIRKLDDNMMLLSESAIAIEHYKAGNGADAALQKRFGAGYHKFFDRGEMLCMADQAGVRMLVQNMDLPAGMELAAQRDALIDQISGVGYVLDIDPLGVMIHGLAKFMPGSTLAGALHGQALGESTWKHSLPNKPYYLAAGADLQAAGALPALEAAASMFNLDFGAFHDVLAQSKSVSFICSPSPAGLSGGLLNDAGLVVHTDDPKAVHAAIRAAMDNAAREANALLAQGHAPAADDPNGAGAPAPPAIEITWTDGKAVGDDGLVADAYQIRSDPSGNMMAMVAQMAIFGQSKRGFIADADHAVVMTFSQRPAVLTAAMNAANGAEASLADDGVLSSVQRWMGEAAPIEIFISLGQITRFAANAAKSMGQMVPVQLPELDPKGPPIGLAFGVGDASMTGTLAMPAPVLAEILKQAEKMMGPGRQHGDGAQPSGIE